MSIYGHEKDPGGAVAEPQHPLVVLNEPIHTNGPEPVGKPGQS
jgi:hypothetical protein